MIFKKIFLALLNILIKSLAIYLLILFILPSTTVFSINKNNKFYNCQRIPMPRYCPPKRKTHSARIESGMRGDNVMLPVCTVLAPEDFGFTCSPSPVLYWYISKPWDKQIIFTINFIEAMETILEKKIIIKKPGIQKIDISQYKVTLEQNKQYEWNIALICDHNQPSRDIITGGVIIRKNCSKRLLERLEKEDKMKHYIFAEEGFWYEAVHNISKLIESFPNNSSYRSQRASLLDQVNLPKVADYDRKFLNE